MKIEKNNKYNLHESWAECWDYISGAEKFQNLAIECIIEQEKRFQRENARRKIKGLKLLNKGETPPEDEKINNDPFLNESAHIIADFISISVG